MKSAVVAASAALLAASPADTPARFSGQCFVQSVRSDQEPEIVRLRASCLSEDLPDGRFKNRFRLVLYDVKGLEFPKAADWIRVQALRSGAMLVASVLWGQIVVVPSAKEVREFMAKAAPAFEVLPQHITVRHSGPDIEILIEEDFREFHLWSEQHRQDIQRLMRR